MSNLGFDSIKRIWPTISGQVTGILTACIFSSLIKFSNPSMVGLLAVTISLMTIIFDGKLRLIISLSQANNEDKLLTTISNDWMDALYRFCVFLTLQYINFYANGSLSNNGGVGILSKIVYMLGAVFILLIVVSVAEFIYEKYKNMESNQEKGKVHYLYFGINSLEVFLRVYNGIYSVIVQFFTNFIYLDIIKLPDQQGIALVSLSGIFFYMVIENTIRKFIDMVEDKSNVIFHNFILKFLDFMIVFSLFYILNYLGMLIGETSGSTTVLSRFVLLFSIYLISYSVFGFLVDITNIHYKQYIDDYSRATNGTIKVKREYVEEKEDNKVTKGENYFLVTSIGRLWPFISGTTTSIFSTIILRDVIKGSSDDTVLFGTLIFLFFYGAIDSVIRKYVDKKLVDKENERWKNMVYEIMDFPISLSALLTYNLLTIILNQKFSSGELGFFSQLIIVAAIQIVSISLFSLIKFFDFFS